jgi:hypothetical protein
MQLTEIETMLKNFIQAFIYSFLKNINITFSYVEKNILAIYKIYVK